MTSEEATNSQDHWTFADWMESRVVILNDNKELKAENARLRQRHAAAVEQAFREALPLTVWNQMLVIVKSSDAAWLASEARKGLEGDDQ